LYLLSFFRANTNLLHYIFIANNNLKWYFLKILILKKRLICKFRMKNLRFAGNPYICFQPPEIFQQNLEIKDFFKIDIRIFNVLLFPKEYEKMTWDNAKNETKRLLTRFLEVKNWCWIFYVLNLRKWEVFVVYLWI